MLKTSLLQNHINQLARFASVGLIATLIHSVCYIALIQLTAVGVILANIMSFIIAFGFSWAGHHYWTFSSTHNKKSKSLLKYFFVAILGLLNNIVLTTLLIQTFHLPEEIGIVPILCITPLLTFLIGKQWAFR